MSYFLESVLPETGPYFLVAIRNGKVRQVHASSFEEITAFADKAPGAGADAYVAIASFKDSTSRKADNAAQKKAFYLDIDCGPTKDYPDFLSAQRALDDFITAASLPQPMLVTSGYGLHVYWPLSTPVAVGAWVPVAKALKQLCIDHGFKADPSVTSDAARILRLPGTKNFKNNTTKDVQIVQQGDEVSFGDFARLMPIPQDTSFLAEAAALGTAKDDAATKAIAGELPKWSFQRLAERSLAGNGCNQIKLAIENAQTLSEPEWRAALSVAWCCEDKDTAIHWISQSHPDYTPEKTLEKAKQTNGAWNCATYREHFSPGCQKCKFGGTNPLAFGKVIESAPLVDGVYQVESKVVLADDVEETVITDIPEFPFPFFRGRNGGVFMRTKDEDGNDAELLVFPYDLYVAGRSYDSAEHGDNGGEIYSLRLHLPHDGVRNMTMAATDIVSKEKLVQGLAKEGAFLIDSKQTGLVMSYLINSMKKFQKESRAAFTRNQMGWTPGHKSFVIGERELTAAGVRLAPACAGLRQISELMTPAGTLAEWRAAANFYARKGQEAKAFSLFVAMGSPLMAMLDSPTVRGAIINLISSESGTGKTTAQLMCNSLWGKPDALMMNQEDTFLSKFHRLGMMNSIAVCIDEVTTMQPKDMGQFAFAATKGRPRHRMEAQSNKMRQNNITWCLPVIGSSNRSMVDALRAEQDSADGELKRIMEIYVYPTAESKAIVDAIFSKIINNYGHAGPMLAQYYVTHYEAVKEQLLLLQTKIDADLNLTTSDRYYSTVFAIAFMGGKIGAELGLHDIPVPEIYAWALELFGEKREGIEDSAMVYDPAESATQALGAYLQDNLPGALTIKANHAPGSLPEAPITVPRGPLRYRYEVDTRMIWVPVKEFNAFLTSRRLNITQIIRALADAKVLHTWQEKGHTVFNRPKRAAAGMVANMSVPSVRCYCIDSHVISSIDEWVANGTAA